MDNTTISLRGISPKPRPAEKWPEMELEEGDLLEEETWPWYESEKWYSVEIGDVIKDRYQVLIKLGFGSVSTVWLCRDLQCDQYVALKIYETGHRQALNEDKALQHLEATIKESHPGHVLVRHRLDSFELPGKAGSHVCLVHEPLSISFLDFRELMSDGKLPLDVVRASLPSVICALNYLHTVAKVVHTDLQESNIMIGTSDLSVFDESVSEEWSNPTPRKTTGGRVVHITTPAELPDDPGPPIITDFGEAKSGSDVYHDEVMPDLYRAPEIILGTGWNNKIDIWALGLLVWDMVDGKHLFTERLPSRKESAAVHLARMISLLGPPPAELIEKGLLMTTFFNEDGTFKHPELVTETSLEAEETRLRGEEKTLFLSFVGKMLRWRPEDRWSTGKLIKHPWLQFKSEEEESDQ